MLGWDFGTDRRRFVTDITVPEKVILIILEYLVAALDIFRF